MTRAVQLGPVLGRKAHVGQHVGFGLAHQRGEFRQPRSGLVGDVTPSPPDRSCVVLGECRPDSGRDDAPLALSCVGQSIAHQMHATPLPRCDEHLGRSRLETFMSTRDNELHAT